MKREDILTEALPYIQQFHGKKIVIKLGGHAMVDPAVLDTVIQDAVLLHYVGMKVVLVHGGGPEITQKMQAMGKEPKFVSGLRITDRETLEIAQMVLVGKINSGIVSLIAKFGARGVGISGNDGNLLIAKKLDLQKVQIGDEEQEVDLGHVGEVVEVNARLLDVLLANDYIPVVAPLAIDRAGQDLNVNADTAAGEIAIALQAYKLINLTDVDGVMNAGRTRTFRRFRVHEAEAMIADGSIAGGMIPKLKACMKALQSGVRFAHIVNGNKEHGLLLELFTDDGIGTMVQNDGDPEIS